MRSPDCRTSRPTIRPPPVDEGIGGPGPAGRDPRGHRPPAQTAGHGRPAPHRRRAVLRGDRPGDGVLGNDGQGPRHAGQGGLGAPAGASSPGPRRRSEGTRKEDGHDLKTMKITAGRPAEKGPRRRPSRRRRRRNEGTDRPFPRRYDAGRGPAAARAWFFRRAVWAAVSVLMFVSGCVLQGIGVRNPLADRIAHIKTGFASLEPTRPPGDTPEVRAASPDADQHSE